MRSAPIFRSDLAVIESDWHEPCVLRVAQPKLLDRENEFLVLVARGSGKFARGRPGRQRHPGDRFPDAPRQP